jgi:hypothetical protein
MLAAATVLVELPDIHLNMNKFVKMVCRCLLIRVLV